jgi:2-keto-4-pentenoate hydratase/2-oxohepta-3-ene-1,7-dioic acid hydratase in catechol pathway
VKIICVGRNYADHAKELNNQVPTEPVIFLKPETALVPKRNPFFLPDFSEDVHYEAELVVRINRIGKNIQEKFAHKYYSQLTVGLDFTARDIQKKLKDKGLPWEKAKAFDGSAAI